MIVTDFNGESIVYRVDVDAVIRQVYAMEEDIFRQVVVRRLLALGYTVIAP